MSITSDVVITRKEAEERVRQILLNNQRYLINKAVTAMSESELTSYLHTEVYYYNIDEEE